MPAWRTTSARLTALLAASAVSLCGCTIEIRPDTPSEPPEASSPSASPAATSPSPSPSALTDDELAQAVVRIAAIDDGSACWSGSGTVIDPSGTILTNAHVVRPERSCVYDELQISVTGSVEDPPVAAYVAEVHAFDADLDLAVLKVARQVDGDPVVRPLPFVEVGDSDGVGLGDTITVLGYPGIGGETITLTQGQVSGFLASAQVQDRRAWIKTSTTIAAGNSGGAALDESGRLIGVPTQVSAGDDVKTADCRRLSDTNGDGVVDLDDTCIPVGGFINGVRPVNLADALIRRAEWSDALALEDLADGPLTPARVTDLRFRRDDQDAVTDPAAAFPSGTARICGVFDFEAMVDGAPVEFLWSIDGVIDEDASNADYAWDLGESGSGRACTGGDVTSLPEGLWQLSISGDQDGPDATGWVHVGDDHPVVALTITNGLDEPICEVQVSPSQSTRWGLNRMAPDAVLQRGESFTVAVGADQYDVAAATCDGDRATRATRAAIAVAAPTTITMNPEDIPTR